MLELLGRRGFDGAIVLEVNTRRATDDAAREADLRESLLYTRMHLAQASKLGIDTGSAENSPPRREALSEDDERPPHSAS
jgi:hypothetical protein